MSPFPHGSTNLVAGLEDDGRQAPLDQVGGGGKAHRPGSDDDNGQVAHVRARAGPQESSRGGKRHARLLRLRCDEDTLPVAERHLLIRRSSKQTVTDQEAFLRRSPNF
jgi:hypothetical protein